MLFVPDRDGVYTQVQKRMKNFVIFYGNFHSFCARKRYLGVYTQVQKIMKNFRNIPRKLSLSERDIPPHTLTYRKQRTILWSSTGTFILYVLERDIQGCTHRYRKWWRIFVIFHGNFHSFHGNFAIFYKIYWGKKNNMRENLQKHTKNILKALKFWYV
jgi:hypothetical protein